MKLGNDTLNFIVHNQCEPRYSDDAIAERVHAHVNASPTPLTAVALAAIEKVSVVLALEQLLVCYDWKTPQVC